MTTKKRRQRRQKPNRSSARTGSITDQIHAAADELMQHTMRKQRATVQALLDARDLTHVDLTDWLGELNTFLIDLCAPLAVDHVIILGRDNADGSIVDVFTASNHQDIEDARKLAAMGHDSMQDDDEGELCPTCVKEYESNLS